jgi:uncharacterized membrane protein YgcG
MKMRITRIAFREYIREALEQEVRLDEIISEVTDVSFGFYCSRHHANSAEIEEQGFEPGGGTFGGGGASGNW